MTISFTLRSILGNFNVQNKISLATIRSQLRTCTVLGFKYLIDLKKNQTHRIIIFSVVIVTPCIKLKLLAIDI